MLKPLLLTTLLLASTFAAAAHRPGPPLICHPLDIGEATTMPEPSERSSTGSIISDTLAALQTAKSTLVRMETLRRATVGLVRDERAACDLLTRLALVAMDAEAANNKSAAGTAYFDAAYLAACYDQMGINLPAKPGVAEGVEGYLWAQHALTLSGGNAEMEFGTALIVHPVMHRGLDAVYRKHLDRAYADAPKGSLLEKNVLAHAKNWNVTLPAKK